MRRLIPRSLVWWLALSTGGSLLALQGCDPNVRSTVLTGVQGASTTLFTTFIQAFFQSLTPPPEDNTATTV